MKNNTTDYLGSILAITNSYGNLVEQRQFGAWGTVDYFSKGLQASEFTHANTLLPRGYTGHEHFFGVALIHMNGRMYDSNLGRFLSPDNYVQEPFNTQNFNRYSYTWNNPLLYVDPNGLWLYPITFRSFHPSKSFGKGSWYAPVGLGRNFLGDDRGFSLEDRPSSRIHHRVVADPQAGTITYTGRGKTGTDSDQSVHPYFGRDTDNPDGYIGKTIKGNNSISFLTGYKGTNPLALGPTPDIDVDAKLTLAQKGNILNINGQVNGDDFPNTEAFITDPSGQKLFIGTDVRATGEDQNPTILFGPATEQIMDINMQIRTNPDTGNFIEVMNNEKRIDIQEWNQIFLNQNPNPSLDK